MTVAEILEDQRRCANRLFDPAMSERYLALQKELNAMAELSTLAIDPGDAPGFFPDFRTENLPGFEV